MKSTHRFSFKAYLAAVAFAAISVFAAQAQAASVYFLKIGSILGESVEEKHRDWIDVGSFSWGLSNAGGKPVFSDFSWTQGIDKSVVPMFVGAVSGMNYKNATFDVAKPGMKGNSVFFQLQFEGVHISSLNITGKGGVESVAASLNFSKVNMTYWPTLKDGSLGLPVNGSWDVAKGVYTGSPLALEGLVLAEPSPSAVPVPAAAWLLGSGLIGLIAVARRKAV